jgi:16S rRNA (guanine527-N7)-methyltransferase
VDRLLDVLGEAQGRGFLGPASLDEHIEHAEGFVEVLGSGAFVGADVLDLGSGGGIPGLVVAARAEGARLHLLDGSAVRAAFLHWAVEYLDWSSRVAVLALRAEEAGREPSMRAAFDVVLARGFAAPPVTAECAAPLLRPGGHLVVSDPPLGGQAAERWPVEGCRLVGLLPEARVREPRSYTVLHQVERCPDRYPRRVGVPGKRPLF